jgi:predicted nucleic-acid-binding Zn-ribbon protein
MKEPTITTNIPKPCPACGSMKYVTRHHHYVWIECKRCGYKGPKMEKLYQAIDGWNRANGEADGR